MNYALEILLMVQKARANGEEYFLKSVFTYAKCLRRAMRKAGKGE